MLAWKKSRIFLQSETDPNRTPSTPVVGRGGKTVMPSSPTMRSEVSEQMKANCESEDYVPDQSVTVNKNTISSVGVTVTPRQDSKVLMQLHTNST